MDEIHDGDSGIHVHDYPWLALATGVLIAGTLGFIAGATTIRKQPVSD